MPRLFFASSLFCGLLLAGPTFAQSAEFTLNSNDLQQGQHMSAKQEYMGFGCTGQNISPQLSWSNAPEGTKAFAILAYDPDAPTGSGWWHWQVVNIPAEVTMLEAGAGNAEAPKLPDGAMHIENDYGTAGFGGACPPKGDDAHRYQFTVYALSQTLDLTPQSSGALTGYMVKANALASSTIETLYKRD